MSIWHTIGRQLQNPSGFTGRFIGRVMSVANAKPNQLAINALRIDPCDTVLELGFGPGHAIDAMASQAFAGMVYGIDQSPVMLGQACRRNRRAIREGRVVLYQAGFEHLPFLTVPSTVRVHRRVCGLLATATRPADAFRDEIHRLSVIA